MYGDIALILAWLGALSIIGGSFLAVGQWDMKRLFACSSISQVGFIMLGIGLATPLGVMGGLAHLLNHSIIKPLLFLNAGAVEYSTGTRQLKELGGLNKSMPITAGTSLIGSLSLAGIPPFNGFWSKFFIIVACVQSGRIFLALAAVIGGIYSLAYLLKVQKYAFFGAGNTKAKEVPFLMSFSMVTLAFLVVVSGLFFPIIVSYLINPAVAAVAAGSGYSKIVLGGM